VQDPGVKGKCHTGYMWPYLDPVQGLIVFDYQPSRGRNGPDQMLKKFTGALQADGYEGYNHFEHQDGITLLGCFAHARRYFEKALNQDNQRATWMLTAIQKIYLVERGAREAGLSYSDRYQLRQEKAAPALTGIKEWLQQNGTKVLHAPVQRRAMQRTVRCNRLFCRPEFSEAMYVLAVSMLMSLLGSTMSGALRSSNHSLPIDRRTCIVPPPRRVLRPCCRSGSCRVRS